MTEQVSTMQSLNDLWNARNEWGMEQFFDKLPDVNALMEFAQWRKEQKDENMEVRVGHDGESKIFGLIMTPEFTTGTMAAGKFGKNLRPVICYGKSPFFNESRYFNAGIRAALEAGAEWVVLMGDDMVTVDDYGVLRVLLENIDNKKFDTVWIDPAPDYYHSYDALLGPMPSTERWAKALLGGPYPALKKFYEKFQVNRFILPIHPIKKPFNYWVFHTLFPPSEGLPLKMTSDFVILSAEWCRKQNPVLNELFIGWEDMDLSLRLKNCRSTMIPWRIGSQIGMNYKPGPWKSMRELFNLAILNELIRRGIYQRI